jgi:hypothetical protein
MKGNLKHQSIRIFFAYCLPVIVLLAGCDLNTGLNSNNNGCSACGENLNAGKIRSSGGNYYTPKGTCLPTAGGPVNCHAYAWSVTCGIPYNLPNYHLVTPAPFWQDGSFNLIAVGSAYSSLPENVRVGDKVVYSTDAHSAVVYSIDKNNPLFISYVIGQPNYKVHSPNDPYYVQGFGTALNFYRVSDTKYCTLSQTPNPSTPPPKIRVLRNAGDGVLYVTVAENTKNSTIGWIYYARMLNSNDLYRYIWVLTFDTGDGWWERRETRQQTSQDTGIIFHQFILKGATKMEVYIYSQDIYGRNTRMIHETRYKSEMGY